MFQEIISIAYKKKKLNIFHLRSMEVDLMASLIFRKNIHLSLNLLLKIPNRINNNMSNML